MKTVKLACLLSVVAFGTACAPVVVSARPAPHLRTANAVQLRGALSPYGEWVSVNAYGSAWRPLGMPVGWQPYTYGTWAWIDSAWQWRSDFEWGWAAFHYGRWLQDARYGWVWVPGDVWGPAWVTWHGTGAYIGWAPLGPSGYRTRTDAWCFVPRDNFGRRHVRRVMVRPAERDRLLVAARPARRAPSRHVRGPAPRRDPRPISAPRAKPAPRVTPAPRARPAPRKVSAPRAKPAPRKSTSSARPAQGKRASKGKPARKRKRD